MGKSIYITLGFLAFALIFGAIGITTYLLMDSNDEISYSSNTDPFSKKQKKKTVVKQTYINNNSNDTGNHQKNNPTKESSSNPIDLVNPKAQTPIQKTAGNKRTNKQTKTPPLHKRNNTPEDFNKQFTSPNMKKFQKEGYKLISRGNLTITIIERANKKILTNKTAQIKIGTKEASSQSDAHGKIQIKDLPIGNWPYKVTVSGFNSSHGFVKIRKGNKSLTVYLKNTGTLKVKATSLDGTAIKSLQMNIDGKLFSLAKGKDNVYQHDISTGANNISFISEGYQKTKKYAISIESNKTAEMFIQLTPTNTIKLKLKGLNQLPNNIRVLAGSTKSWKLATKAFPDLEGFFEVEYVDLSNDILIQVPFHTPFPIYANDREAYTKTFPHSYKGEITVTFDKKPLSSASLFFPDYGITIPANKKGIIHIPDLEPELELKFIVRAEGFKEISSKLKASTEVTKKTFSLKVSDTAILTAVDENDEPISQATVHILESKARKHTFYKTDDSGSVLLSDLKKGSYIIVCHHIDYGAAQKAIKITDKDLEKDALKFKLHPQKSLEVIVKDSKGSPLENRTVEIKGAMRYNNEAFNSQLEYTMQTDKEGKIKLLNMIPDRYRIRIFDDLYESNWRVITTPRSSLLTINAKLKNYIAVTLKTPDGSTYNDVASFFYRHGTRIVPVKVDKMESGKYYINRKAFNGAWSFYPMVQTEGYSLANYGFTRRGNTIPDEITFNLKKGATLKLNIIDRKTSKVITGATATFSYNNTNLYNLPSDEAGIIIAEGLETNFSVNITHNDYTEHTIDFIDFTEYQELKIEMIKGGVIKGKYIRNANQTNSIAIVKLVGPVKREIQIGKENYFEFAKLPEGQYQITVFIGDKENSLDSIKLPNPINLLNEQIVEIDIDESSLRLGNIAGKIEILKDTNATSYKVELFDRTSWLKSLTGGSLKPADSYTAKADGLFEFNELNPGKYLVRVQAGSSRSSEKWITVHSETTESLNIAYPPYQLLLDVQFEAGGDKGIDTASPKIMVFVYEEDTYSYINFYDFYNRNFKGNTRYGKYSRYYLTPKVNYTIVFQEDLRYNYDILRVSNIVNSDSTTLTKAYTLPTGRVFNEIKVVDQNNKPIKDAGYLITKNNETILRDLWQSSDMFPFTNNEGKFASRGTTGKDESPRGWPVETFHLQVNAKGYATKTITLDKEVDTTKPVVIQLEKENTIIVNITASPDYPFSIGLIKDGTNKILPLPILLENRLNRRFTTYIENAGKGQYTFHNLPKDSYKIGIYVNGTNELLGTTNKITLDKKPTESISINVAELINQ